jgi:hypothetical protein
MTLNQVRAKLLEKHNSSFRKFALDNGYEIRNVHQVVSRYAGTEKKPRGILAWKILRDISIAIDEPIIDGLDELIK